MWPAPALARFSLALTALVFAGFGLTLLLSPDILASMGVELTTPESRAEIRAFYGGLELGLAVFFALAAFKESWFQPGLWAQVLTLGGAAFGRMLGMLVDGAAGNMLYLLTAAELGGCLIGVFALWRFRTSSLSPETAAR